MRLPSLSSKQIIRALRKAGFSEAPDIPRGTLLAILEQAGLSREEFFALI